MWPLGLLLSAHAQQLGKVWRIGYLGSTPTTNPDAAIYWAAFKNALQERGYIVGRNLALEQRFTEGMADRYPALAAELVNLKVDVIVVARRMR